MSIQKSKSSFRIKTQGASYQMSQDETGSKWDGAPKDEDKLPRLRALPHVDKNGKSKESKRQRESKKGPKIKVRINQME